MQIRQVLTDPNFLQALNDANTSAARKSEFKRLTDYAANLDKNTKKLKEDKHLSFDVGFEPIRAMHDSQSVIDFLVKVTREAAQNPSIKDVELVKLLRDFFAERNLEIQRTRCDYFPSLPTDGNKLLWQLAEALIPTWKAFAANNNEKAPVCAATILMPTLKKPGFPRTSREGELSLGKDHVVVLNSTREYAISLENFLYRFHEEGLSYYNPMKNHNEMLTDDEVLRVNAAFMQYEDPRESLLKKEHRNINNYTRLKTLREEGYALMQNKIMAEEYYAADLAYYEKLLAKPWLLNNLPALFDMMGCMPRCEWGNYCDLILKNQDINAIPEDVENPRYYANDDDHDDAASYFFWEVRKRKRDLGYEYNNYVPQLLSFLSTNLADKLAYSKTTKEAAIVIAQSCLTENRPRGEEFMEAYFVETKHKDLFPVLKDGQTGKIAEQNWLHGKQHGAAQLPPASIVAQGMFAEKATNVAKAEVQPEQDNNKQVAMKAS